MSRPSLCGGLDRLVFLRTDRLVTNSPGEKPGNEQGREPKNNSIHSHRRILSVRLLWRSLEVSIGAPYAAQISSAVGFGFR